MTPWKISDQIFRSTFSNASHWTEDNTQDCNQSLSYQQKYSYPINYSALRNVFILFILKQNLSHPDFPDVSVCKTTDLNIQNCIDCNWSFIFYSLINIYSDFENIAKIVSKYKTKSREDFVVNYQWTLSLTEYILATRPK